MERPVNLLFWQPVVSGKQFLQRFLRLKIAAEMLGGDGKGMMERMRSQLRRGEAAEIAGYLLSSTLAGSLENAELMLSHRSCRVEWIEISSKSDGGLSPVAVARLSQWQAAGHHVRGISVNGPAFWQTVEITGCPALLKASIMALSLIHI